LAQALKRGTLESVKDGGTVYVLLDADQAAPEQSPDAAQTPDRTELLIGEMQDRIAYLERQVEEEREACRRADTLLARLMDRLPELESPERPLEGAVSATEPRSDARAADRKEAQEATEAPQRSWWRRMFGG
jgi:hypothetical protein